jgi:hypothetical protein
MDCAASARSDWSCRMSLRITSVDELPAAMRDQVREQLEPAKPIPSAMATAARKALMAETQSKYRNQRYQDVDGETYDSKLEWRCHQWLKARAIAGEILWMVRQVPFVLEGGVRYRCDFLAVLAAGGVEVIDAKGRDTQASKNKRKQVLARYGVEVHLWPSQNSPPLPS